jgi:hypothetical protein
MLGQELTQEILIHTLALLTSHSFGKFLSFRSLLNVIEGRHVSFQHTGQPEADFHPRRLIFPGPRRPGRGVYGRLHEEFHDLRDDSMTLNEGIRRNLLHRDTRIPNRSALFLSPRHKQKKNQKSRDFLGRTSHGVARATESLRELRVSLVPRFEPRKCLLPTV